MKVTTMLILFISFVVFMTVSFILIFNLVTWNFACAYPKYKKIVNGLTKTQIVKILGKPDKKRIKAELTGNVFGKGEYEQKLKIKEEWKYEFFGYRGSISVYFDINGITVLKGCGEG